MTDFGSVMASSRKNGPDGFDVAVADGYEAVPAIDQDVLLGA